MQLTDKQIKEIKEVMGYTYQENSLSFKTFYKGPNYMQIDGDDISFGKCNGIPHTRKTFNIEYLNEMKQLIKILEMNNETSKY